MDFLRGSFATYPELAVYLALGLGFWLGNLKCGGLSLGGTTGSLLVGILLGLLFPIPPLDAAKSLVFLLFLFGIGYEVGPQFISTLKSNGWRFAALGAFMPAVGLLTAALVAAALHLSPGFAAGLLSGALTQSPAMGTAVETIQALPLSDALKQTLAAQVAVADALCYLGGALGVLLFCSTIGPRLLHLDLPTAARELEAHYGISRHRDGLLSAWEPSEYRTFRLAPTAPPLTAAQLEQRRPGLTIERLRRHQTILDVLPHTPLQPADVLLVSGKRRALVASLGTLAQEVDDPELLHLEIASFHLYVSAPTALGRPLEDLAQEPALRGLFLRRLSRQSHEIPLGTRTQLQRGDVLHLVGSAPAQQRAIRFLGPLLSPSDPADLAAVGGAIFLGALLGAAASCSLGHISFSLGTSLGALLAGIATGYLRSLRPLLGRLPDAAVKFMQSYGLAAFVAIVGLAAGPHFLSGLREAGLGLFLGGLLVTFAPLFAGLYFGRSVLGIPPLLLLGAIAGGQTFTPGLAAIQEKSRSPIAVLGYAAALPIAHLLLTFSGTLMVLFRA